MQKRLNPKKVVEEIDSILVPLKKHLKTKDDFEDLHKKALRLSQVLFQTKKEYKSIDVVYPVSIVIVFKNFSGDGPDEKIHSPNKEQQWQQKENLLKNIIEVLTEAREIYSLKNKLLL